MAILNEGKGVTARCGVHRIVWFEEYIDIRDATDREKQIKIADSMEDLIDQRKKPGLE